MTMTKKEEESRNGQGHQMIEWGKEVAQGIRLGEVEGESRVKGLQWKCSEDGDEIAIWELEHHQESCISGFDPSTG